MHSNALYTHIDDSLLSVSRVFPVEYSIPFCLEQSSRGTYFRFGMFWPFQHQETGVNFKKFLDLYCPLQEACRLRSGPYLSQGQYTRGQLALLVSQRKLMRHFKFSLKHRKMFIKQCFGYAWRRRDGNKPVNVGSTGSTLSGSSSVSQMS